VRSLLADLGPLRESAAFRRLLAGQSLSLTGSFMTRVAVAVQVYALTGSSFAVGLVGLATAVPLLVLGLAGGSVADAVDRRRLVLGTAAPWRCSRSPWPGRRSRAGGVCGCSTCLSRGSRR